MTTDNKISWFDCVRVIEGPEHLMKKEIGICIKETDIASMVELGIKVIRIEKYDQCELDEYLHEFRRECEAHNIEVLVSLHEVFDAEHQMTVDYLNGKMREMYQNRVIEH